MRCVIPTNDKIYAQTRENLLHTYVKDPSNQMIPLQGVCQVCQVFQGSISHFSTYEERSAATPDRSDDDRPSPTAHKLKCQLSGCLSRDNKGLPTDSKFPAFSEQIFQTNHLIKQKANFLMEVCLY